MYDAIVVGSGPNGFGAAITLARAGRSVLLVEGNATLGGGARSETLTLPGFVHDVCSAIHPLGLASPLFGALELERWGLTWRQPEIPLAHPLDGGQAAILRRSVADTAAGLGADGAAWTRLVGPYVRGWDAMRDLLLSPTIRVPRAPFLAARFGLRALRPAAALAERRFGGPLARALFAGCAAHSFARLDAPLTASFGLALAVSAHAVGWPSPYGGTQRLTDALAGCLRAAGGEIRTGAWIERLGDLPESRAVLFDTSAWDMVRICGDALPARYRDAVARFRPGPGVFKLDLALDGPVPWAHADCRRAGTVHVGGTLEEIAAAERAVSEGRYAERPFVLVAQHAVFDDRRAPAGKHTLWAYCHVPRGATEDMTERIEAQIERFAPGFRRLVLARSVRSPADVEASNPNYAGGDITTGAVDGLQLFFRPTRSAVPWATPSPRLFICSAATPPGPGVHGMCGFWAARAALRRTLA